MRTGVNLAPPIGRRMPPGGPNEFAFLNRSQRFSDGKVDWRSPDKDKLWRYNLHYFDYVLDQDRPRASIDALIDDWIERNPPGTPDAWEPFPVSLRIVNWVKLLLRPEYRERPNAAWLNSLHQQALWLERNLEKHLLANHYFKNGKALLFAGLFFAGADADRWLRKGARIVGGEIGEQILPDGGHFERSPMYHAMILEDCLDLLNICASRTETGTDWAPRPVAGGDAADGPLSPWHEPSRRRDRPLQRRGLRDREDACGDRRLLPAGQRVPGFTSRRAVLVLSRDGLPRHGAAAGEPADRRLRAGRAGLPAGAFPLRHLEFRAVARWKESRGRFGLLRIHGRRDPPV